MKLIDFKHIFLAVLFVASSIHAASAASSNGWGNETAALQITDLSGNVVDAEPKDTAIRLTLLVENIDEGETPGVDTYIWSDNGELSAHLYNTLTTTFAPGAARTYNYSGDTMVIKPSISALEWTNTATNDADSVIVSSIAIAGSGATHISGKDWATVKSTGSVATAEATTTPNNSRDWKLINWTGATPLTGNAKQATVSISDPILQNPKAEMGYSAADLNVWPIWVDLTIDTSTSLDPIHNSTLITNGTWPTSSGGGSALGPVDHSTTPALTNRFAKGRMQGVGKIYPSGAENIITQTAWGWTQKVHALGYENGSHNYDAPPGSADDLVGAGDCELTPALTGGKLFAADDPGCPIVSYHRFDYEFDHTAETYDDFSDYTTINLGSGATRCSDVKYWYYRALIDKDSTPISIVNVVLPTTMPNFPTGPYFRPRHHHH